MDLRYFFVAILKMDALKTILFNHSESAVKVDQADRLSSYGKDPQNLIDKKDNTAESVTWTSTEFGTSTDPKRNTISVDDENKTVTLTAGSKDGSETGGKITGSQDGMSYYYTSIDPSKNFDLSAEVKVNYFEKATPDKQAGFGIMARDTIGPAGSVAISNSNMCLVGGYQGVVESVFRNGVVDSSGTGAKMEDVHKFANRPANDGTATYKLRLRKTNTGYIASVDDGTEITYYRPKQLEILDKDHIYLGFFAARVASITVSNINYLKKKNRNLSLKTLIALMPFLYELKPDIYFD